MERLTRQSERDEIVCGKERVRVDYFLFAAISLRVASCSSCVSTCSAGRCTYRTTDLKLTFIYWFNDYRNPIPDYGNTTDQKVILFIDSSQSETAVLGLVIEQCNKFPWEIIILWHHPTNTTNAWVGNKNSMTISQMCFFNTERNAFYSNMHLNALVNCDCFLQKMHKFSNT